jgi:hypothetical protein
VQHRTHFLRGQVDGGFAVVADDEAMTVTMALDAAFDFTQQCGACGCAA